MSMACPCCSVGGQIHTLESNVVDLKITKANREHSCSPPWSPTRQRKLPKDGRILARFELCKPRDISARPKNAASSCSSASHCKGLSSTMSMQHQAPKDSRYHRTIASQSKESARPGTHERKTLAFVLQEKDAPQGVLSSDLPCKHSLNWKNHLPESAGAKAPPFTACLYPTLPCCREIGAVNMGQNDSKAHLRIGGMPDELVNKQHIDLVDSEESEREFEDAICLTTFTFGSKSQSLPLFESRTRGSTGLIRQLSTGSCISMLSLDCTEDQLSVSGNIEPFSSADFFLQEKTRKLSSCFPETRSNLEAVAVEPCLNFREPRRMQMPCIQAGSNLRMGQESTEFSSNDLSMRKDRSVEGHTRVLQPEKNSHARAKEKKRSSSARHKMANRKEKKAFLNFRRCRGVAGLNAAPTRDRAFNLGVGVGVLCMLFANWQEFRRLNDLLERTESVVQEMQQCSQSKNSPFLTCLSSLRLPNLETVQVKRDEEDESSHHGAFKGMVTDERERQSKKMADLEAALEAELSLMQKNFEETEAQQSQEDFDEWKTKEDYSSVVDELLRKSDDNESPQTSSVKDRLLTSHNALSPNALSQRLQEVLVDQQEKKILGLEAEIDARKIELMLKEKEMQCWKDIAHHLVRSFRDKPEETQSCATLDKGRFFVDDNDGKALRDPSFNGRRDGRKHFYTDSRLQQSEDSKSTSCASATTSIAREDTGISGRPHGISASLIDPSFEALISRNTIDWSVGEILTHSTESAWKETNFSGFNDIARHCGNEAWADREPTGLMKGLDADEMFPWLRSEEDQCSENFHNLSAGSNSWAL